MHLLLGPSTTTTVIIIHHFSTQQHLLANIKCIENESNVEAQEGGIGYLGNESGPTLASSEGISLDLFLLVCFASQRLLRIQDTLFAITFVDVAKQYNAHKLGKYAFNQA